MINIQLSVAEAISLYAIVDANIRNHIVKGIEIAIGVKQNCDVTITTMPGDNRIPCIKVIRSHSGWGLREAKEFTDVLVGRYDSTCGKWIGGSKNTMKLPTRTSAETLLSELTNLGCEGFIS